MATVPSLQHATLSVSATELAATVQMACTRVRSQAERARAACPQPLVRRRAAMPMLSCDVSDPMMQALMARRARTGEPLLQIVTAAPGEALEVEHPTLFQVSLRARW